MAPRQHGVVLTYVPTLDELQDCMTRGGYDTIKVVTGWGVEGGWTQENMQRLVGMAPNIIVRTVTGDPSAGGHDPNNRFPDPARVEQELAPWYALRQDLLFEIGNEPNIDDIPSDDFIWGYRFQLDASLARARNLFPQGRFISPGLIIGPGKRFERFNEIARDVFRKFDLIGLHVYEFFSFSRAQQLATTDQLRIALAVAQRLYPDMPWYITEYGINDVKQVSNAEKGQRYCAMTYYGASDPPLPRNLRGLVYYHLATKNDLHQAYQIYPDGDMHFLARRQPPPPPSLAPFVADPWAGIVLADLSKPPFSVSEQIRDN